MSPALIVVIVVAFIVFDVIILAMILRRKSKGGAKREDQMSLLAGELGLTVVGGDPLLPGVRFLAFLKKPTRLEGQYKGIPMEVLHYTRGSGNSQTTYAAVRARVANPRGLTLRFAREGVMAKIGKSLGMQDVETGDDALDKLLLVKSSDPDFVRTAMLPKIREELKALWRDHRARGAIALKGDTIGYEESGRIRDAATRQRFAAAAALLADLGGVVAFYNR